MLQILYEEFPNPRQPKTLAAQARTPYEGTKKWLARSRNIWTVETSGGWYRAWATPALLHKVGMDPVKVHALQVSAKSLNGGTPPQLQGLGHAKTTKDGQVMRQVLWNGRMMTIQPTADGARISVRASTDPISVPLFAKLAAYLEGLCAPARVMVEDFDLATDTQKHRLKMSLPNSSFSLGGFRFGLVKLYDKAVIDATRLEACFHRVDLGMAEVVSILNAVVTPPWMPPSIAPWNPPEVA